MNKADERLEEMVAKCKLDFEKGGKVEVIRILENLKSENREKWMPNVQMFGQGDMYRRTINRLELMILGEEKGERW